MKQNTNAGLPQEENLIREMREIMRASRPGISLSLRMESFEAAPVFVAVLGDSYGIGETADYAITKCAEKAANQIEELKRKADGLGLMLVAKPETAAAEL